MTEEEATRIARLWCEKNDGWSTELVGHMELDTFMITVRTTHWVTCARVYDDTSPEELQQVLYSRREFK